MNKASDVIVIGAGVVGCAAAYYLAKRGVKVTVLERREVACGASGRNGSGARQSGRDNRELPLAMFGVKHIWPTLGEELGEDIEYIQNGNMRLGKTEKDREALEELVKRLDRSMDEQENARIDKQIHFTLAQASGNVLLLNILEACSGVIDTFIRNMRAEILRTKEAKEALNLCHRQIAEALRNKDNAAGKDALDRHFRMIDEILEKNGEVAALIKPQFEAGREKVGKKGVVRDKAVHEEVIHKVIDYAVEIGFHILNLEYSPIKGPEGNIEYLVYIRKEAEGSREESVDVHAVVEAAHGELDK